MEALLRLTLGPFSSWERGTCHSACGLNPSCCTCALLTEAQARGRPPLSLERSLRACWGPFVALILACFLSILNHTIKGLWHLVSFVSCDFNHTDRCTELVLFLGCDFNKI